MGKSFDLMIFSSSANRAALTAVPMVAGETAFTGNGIPGVATQIYAKGPSTVRGAMVVSETAACLNARMHGTSDPSWNRLDMFTRLQTVQPVPKDFVELSYPLVEGEAVTAEVLNAGAVLDSVALFIDKGSGIAKPIAPDAKLADGYMLVQGTCTLTCVADQLTPGTAVFSDYVLDTKRQYHIAGMAADAATGHFTRLKHIAGPNVDDHPGVPTADTAAGLDNMMYYGDFGTFNGLNGVMIEQLSEGADAAVNLTFLIKEI